MVQIGVPELSHIVIIVGLYTPFTYIPVVPHKAVADVSE